VTNRFSSIGTPAVTLRCAVLPPRLGLGRLVSISAYRIWLCRSTSTARRSNLVHRVKPETPILALLQNSRMTSGQQSLASFCLTMRSLRHAFKDLRVRRTIQIAMW